MFEQTIGEPLDRRSGSESESFGAGAKTDYFRDPASDNVIASAPFVYDEVAGDFTLTVRVEPSFSSTYDAGAILLMSDEEQWLKFAYELTDIGYPAAVSVVTRGRSDDCNGEPWRSGSVLYRLSRRGSAVGCYYGERARDLKMHRLLTVPGEPSASLRLGLSVQSPTGEGCRCSFSEISFEPRPVSDMRRGTMDSPKG